VPNAVIVTRFAPSPTGWLHLGHAYSALLAHDRARRSGGRFVLRIEDIDAGRCRPEFIAAILSDLAWLGLTWDGPVRRQSEHLGDYRAALDQLRAQGLLYPCFCTRADIAAEIARSGSAPHGPDGPLYPGLCKHRTADDVAARIASGQPYAWRLHSDRAAAITGPLQVTDERHGTLPVDAAAFGDVVLARKDTPTSYHLAVSVDDALQGVTTIIRGEDLLAATAVHRTLQALLALPEPRYHHHALLTDDQGQRYAKRDRALTLDQLRRDGATPADIRARVGL
jgi:glutamyl-Q tRNA(Asp) synthetase